MDQGADDGCWQELDLFGGMNEASNHLKIQCTVFAKYK